MAKTVVKKKRVANASSKKTTVRKRPSSSSSPKSNRIKTYRVLKDGMRVGNSKRNFGDFMPEAATMPTLRTLLNTNVIEEYIADPDEFAAWQADQEERDEEFAAELAELYAKQNGEEVPKAKPRKVKPKRKVAKKTASKKIVKKGKSSGRKLEQQRV